MVSRKATQLKIESHWGLWLPYLLISLSVFAAYSNVFSNHFLFDDGPLITDNELLRSWKSFGQLLISSTTAGAHIAGGFFRPIQDFIYLFIYQLAGPSIFAFHLLNVSLHAINGCLVYKLGTKLNFNKWGAFVGAALWALHPLHTEAITYMSGTADPLYVSFCLLGLILLLPDFTRQKILLSVPVFILALLSKETAVIFPMLAMSCIYLISKKRLAPQSYLCTWPLWVVAAFYLMWRLSAADLNGPQNYSHVFAERGGPLTDYAGHISLRFYTSLATLPAYFSLILWPTHLHMERIFSIFQKFWNPPVLIGSFMLILMGAQVIWGKGRRGLSLCWGFVWFLIAQFPNAGIFFPTNSLFLEHWMYLPTIGLFLGVTETGWATLSEKRFKKMEPFAIGGLVTLAAFLGFLTYNQNAVWKDPISFYKNIINYGEASSRAHSNLALSYMEAGSLDEAIEEFHKAIAITDSYAETRNNLAVTLLMLPDSKAHIPEALDNLNRALVIDPNYYRSYEVLALIYDNQGNHKKSVESLKKAQEIKAALAH